MFSRSTAGLIQSSGLGDSRWGAAADCGARSGTGRFDRGGGGDRVPADAILATRNAVLARSTHNLAPAKIG